MGLRHRSIRLRVGILIIVPVLCLIALYGFAAAITLGSALTETHARTIKDDLATPVTSFQIAIDTERHDALLSLAAPTNTQYASSLGQQEAKTQTAVAALNAAMAAPAVTSDASVYEKAAITAMIRQTKNLPYIRQDVADDAISLTGALNAYDAIISAGYIVIDQAIAEQANVSLVTQAQAVINLDEAAQDVDAEADLLTADMTQLKFPASDRIAFAQLANLRQNITTQTLPQLQPPYRGLLATYVTPAVTAALNTAESSVINTPWRKGLPPAQLLAVGPAFENYGKAISTALGLSANKLQQQAQNQADTVILELVLAAGLGLIGTVASIILSLVIGRGLVRQLRELREDALSLANQKLPDVISQLRAGQPVDVSEYTPAPQTTSNEIEQVQHAFAVVQQTAVQSAIDESRLRRGISEVFRNLAGRSQSLLHRQLTLLDGMERRATEPDELEDLFRIDHLTTRMRRHAEGLIILSGEAPSRGWRQPVPLVDVLRAAVAEVEDYTRIRVLSRTNAAVAGHAVADVIHLIAELAENATVFSPPNTPVRIQGDIVGRGFAIEIEDRGLGISQARLDEINANLANPPQFDLSGSDRLGLFIAGQLAQRHDIKISLRPSVYGGTTAIVLIPTSLVVEEDSYQRDPALIAGAGASDESPADRFAARNAVLAQAATSRPGNGNVISLEPEYSRMTLTAISSHSAADPDQLATAPRPAAPAPPPAARHDQPDNRVSTAELAELGLPVRVRQASMAPQLRDTTASPAGRARAADPAAQPGPAVPLRPVTETASPEEVRNTVSALQRGWQLGRAEGQQSGLPDSGSFGRPGDAPPNRPVGDGPSRGDNGLPSRGDNGLPSRGDSGLPSRGDNGLPDRGNTDLPDRAAADLPDRADGPGRTDGDKPGQADTGLPDRAGNGLRSWATSEQANLADSDGPGSATGDLPSWASSDPSSRAGSGAGQQAEAETFGRHGSYQLSRGGSGPVQPSGAGPFGRPDADSFSGPDTESFTGPATGPFSRPGSGSFDRPGSGSFDRPGSGSFDRPDTGSFDRPDTGSFDRPDTGSFSRPGAGLSGRPESSSYERPEGGSLGWPGDTPTRARPSTDRLPAHSLAADRLAAERLAAERLAADGRSGNENSGAGRAPAGDTDEPDED